jgi:hypothetical protein
MYVIALLNLLKKTNITYKFERLFKSIKKYFNIFNAIIALPKIEYLF